MRSFHLSLILSLITAFGSSTLADDNTQRAPELQVLDHFVGKWDQQVTETLNGGESVSYEYTSIRAWSRGGRFIRFEDVVKGRPETHILMTYDPTEKNYPAVFMSGPTRFNLTATWDESTRVMSFTGALPDGNRLSSTHRFVSKTRAESSSVITNPDGEVVAKISHKQTRSEQSSEGIEQLDTNGDGRITRDEAPEDLKLFFGQYDVNKDGAIDAREAKALEKYARSPQAASTKSVPAAGRVTAAQVVGYMDKNNDKKISRKEASEELKPHFSQFDTNKDGVIDVKEAQVMADYANGQQAPN